MRHGSTFSGLGGTAVAAREMGWATKWFSETDAYASAQLAKNFPGVPNHGDIRNIKGQLVAPVDILTGGFPCQDISLAGKGAGITGARSGLWSEFARLIEETLARWVLAENVSALRSRGLDRVLKDFDALGYDAEWHCVPASFVGAPQRRDRIIIVAHTRSSGIQGLGALPDTRVAGPWGWRGEEDLRAVAAAPFERGDRWPQPLVRRVDDGIRHRVDRLRALGNTVVPQLVLLFFRAIEDAERRLLLTQEVA